MILPTHIIQRIFENGKYSIQFQRFTIFQAGIENKSTKRPVYLFMEEEQFYTCPYCFSEVSIIVDKSVKQQTYIEDCERCCNPIEFTMHIEDNEITLFSAVPIQQ